MKAFRQIEVLLSVLVILAVVARYSSLCQAQDSLNSSITNSESTQTVLPYNEWNETKEMDTEQQKQEVYLATETDYISKINSLQNEATTKLAEAHNAHKAAETMRLQFLDAKKKFMPRDPWRNIYSQTKYVKSIDSGFTTFSGQIQEISPEGIRVLGQIGQSTEKEYFLINFPYDFKVGESIDPTRIYVAFEDGVFTYVSEDGFAKTLPKLNYGKTCERPVDASTIELASNNLDAGEAYKVKTAELDANDKDDAALDAEKRLRQADDELSLTQQSAAAEEARVKKQTLEYDLNYANKGDVLALRKMGERYREGDTVETNLAMAEEYSQKAEAVAQAERERIKDEERHSEQEAIQQKFLRSLNLADTGNLDCILYVGKCYRDGIGTDKNVSKAREYFQKGIDLHSIDAAKLLFDLDNTSSK